MAKPIHGLTATARSLGFVHGGYIPTGMIHWRLGHIHVSTSALTVAREFWHERAKAYPRNLKRAIVRAALKEHAANRGLYHYVMSGTR
jgi:hypothetical protein